MNAECCNGFLCHSEQSEESSIIAALRFFAAAIYVILFFTRYYVQLSNANISVHKLSVGTSRKIDLFMLIKSVHIENFKRFKDLEIDFKPLDCLVGANNSGKSTLLQALALFDFVVHNCISKRNGNNHDLEIKKRSLTTEDFVILPVAKAVDLWTDRITQGGNNKHIIICINVTFDNDEQVKAKIDLSYNRFSIELDTKSEQNWLQNLINFKISYLPVFSSFLTQEERRTPAVIEDALARGRVNSVIRNLLYNLDTEKKISQLEEILLNAIPTFSNLTISFQEKTDRFIDVSYKEAGKKKSFDLFMAGSGFQQFVYLFGFILLRNPDVILLDEPDVHLHGTMQGSLLKEFNNLIEQGKQVIFATHSHDLIIRLEADQIINLSEGDAKRLNVKFDIYDTLKSLGSIDNIQIAQLQTYRRLLVVEDLDDWKYLQIFGPKIIELNKWQEVERKLSIFPAKGNPHKQDMQRIKQQLNSLLSLSGESLKMFVICDLDYYPYREELIIEKSSQDPDIQYNIWERTEIENYILSPDIIYRLAASKKNSDKELFEEPFNEEFNNILNSSKEEVETKIIKEINYYWRKKKLGWDAGTEYKKMKEIIAQRWENERLYLTDAKDFVLPKIKLWLQDNGFKQFSNKSLAESFAQSEIPEEIKNTVNEIVSFTGL